MIRFQRAWEHCPNCDAPLSERVFVGGNWECIECGESGIRKPGPWDWDTVEYLLSGFALEIAQLAGEADAADVPVPEGELPF